MDKLFLFLSDSLDTDLSKVSWYLLDTRKTDAKKDVQDTEVDIKQGVATLEEFSVIYQKNFPAMDISVLLSGQYLTYKTVAATIKNQRQMLQALPFIVEEHIIGNIDDMHISIPGKWTGDSVFVAVIDKGVIKNIIDKFSHYELPLKNIYGLPDLLTPGYGEFKIFLYDNKVLFKGGGECFECDEKNIIEMIELVPRENISETSINYIKNDKASLAIAKKLRLKLESDGIEVSLTEVIEEPIYYLLRDDVISILNPINLLQGEFNKSGANGSGFERYSPILWAAMLCLLIQISFNFVSGYYFNYHAGRFLKTSEEIYLKNFPEEKTVKNVKSQLNGKLREATAKKSNTGFSYLVTKSFLAMKNVDTGNSIKFNTFRYDVSDQELKIELNSPTIGLLDKLKEGMSNNGFDVKILSAKQDKDAINSVLVIKLL